MSHESGENSAFTPEKHSLLMEYSRYAHPLKAISVKPEIPQVLEPLKVSLFLGSFLVHRSLYSAVCSMVRTWKRISEKITFLLHLNTYSFIRVWKMLFSQLIYSGSVRLKDEDESISFIVHLTKHHPRKWRVFIFLDSYSKNQGFKSSSEIGTSKN